MARRSEKSACEEEGEERWDVMKQMNKWVYNFGNCVYEIWCKIIRSHFV